MSIEHPSSPPNSFYRVILDAIPLPVFVVNEDVRVLDFNEVAGRMLGQNRELVLRRRGGEVLHCLHSTDVPEGCGHGEYCKDCIIRNSVNASFAGQRRSRVRTHMELVDQKTSQGVELLVTTTPFEFAQRKYVLLVLEDVSELTALRGLLPICAKCKKIRDDQQYWHSLETYMGTHLNIDFSHGLCPDCLQEYYPDRTPQPSA